MFSKKLVNLTTRYTSSSGAWLFTKRAFSKSLYDATQDAETYYDNYLKIFKVKNEKVVDLHFEDHVNERSVVDDHAQLTHTDDRGQIKMVGVEDKLVSKRTAAASCVVSLGTVAFSLIERNAIKKGDVLCVAKIAGIMAAKNTSGLIPLCHNIPLSKVDVTIDLDRNSSSLRIQCSASTTAQTGVEMEALVGASTAALTVYDMCKAVTHAITISDVKLLQKTGGSSGDYHA